MNKKSTLYTLLLAGCALGWLVGLSASPVIASLLGILVTAIIGVGNLKYIGEEDNSQVLFGVKIISLIVIGISIGATGGVYTRTHDLLGFESKSDVLNTMCGLSTSYEILEAEVDVWNRLTNISKEEISKHLFGLYSKNCTSGNDDIISDRSQSKDMGENFSRGALFSNSRNSCDELISSKNLSRDMIESNELFQKIGELPISDDMKMELVKLICMS